MRRKKLITTNEAVRAKGQHKQPCSDCPWARASLPGWLGGSTADDWLKEGHGDHSIPCHVFSGAQCAGAAIYRRNVLKTPRDPECLRLEANREVVFATPVEFKQHHERPAGERFPDLKQSEATPRIALPLLGTGDSVMPKSENIAANLKIDGLKSRHADQLTKVKEASEKKVEAAKAAGTRAISKIVADVQKITGVIGQATKLVNEKVTDEKLAARINALLKKAGEIAGKHLTNEG